MKKCTKCGVVQPVDQFYGAKGTRDGLRGECKSCFKARAKARYPLVRDRAIARTQKWRQENPERYRATQRRIRATPEGQLRQRAGHLKRKFGLTLEKYDAIVDAQGGGCAICGDRSGSKFSLHVDHDHQTGRIRGILCFRHNNALGDFNDDPGLLMKAARYLTSFDEVVIEETELALHRVRDLVLQSA